MRMTHLILFLIPLYLQFLSNSRITLRSVLSMYNLELTSIPFSKLFFSSKIYLLTTISSLRNFQVESNSSFSLFTFIHKLRCSTK